MKRRSSGVLLHISSLPSRFGVGDFGPAARRFADFLERAGQACWQILPLTPTSPYIGNSPYSSDSAFALNEVLVSPERMVSDGYLTPKDLEGHVAQNTAKADYEGALTFKTRLLETAFDRVGDALDNDLKFTEFCRENAFWLDDYALFLSLKQDNRGEEWAAWPEKQRDRDPDELAARAEADAQSIQRVKFSQFLLFSQWAALRRDLAERGIQVIGDLPIYVTLDSADVWAAQDLFKLGPDRRPTHVAGVPPDYFSETGQRWGNPVYDWKIHAKTGFAWWMRRMEHNFGLYDFIRLDHFRGFEAYWEIPAKEKTAVRGEWIKAPGRALFDKLLTRFPSLPIIAEDLGVITAEVRELKEAFGFPGMKILQFAFGEDTPENRDAPHNYNQNCVAYTGSHDNNTTLGWVQNELDETGRDAFFAYIGRDLPPEQAPWELIRLAMASVAGAVVVPMQDLLRLGEQARMNTPSVAKGNWTWRLLDEQLTAEPADRLLELTRLFGRARS